MATKYAVRGFHIDEVHLIDSILADPRGWVHLGYLFSRVRNKKDCDVIIYKKTPEQMDKKFTNPDLKGLSVCTMNIYPIEICIHEGNWNNVPQDFEGSLLDYRAYLVQHEMGHALGYMHESPLNDPNELCPVMYQQTKGTRGICRYNPWQI